MSGLDEQLVGADGPRTILILGGTSEARQLAECLVENPRFGQCAIVSSLAGRVSHPRLPQGEVRVGGFGGIPGLGKWVEDHHVVELSVGECATSTWRLLWLVVGLRKM